ncbi:YlbF family regulator [Streptococcus sciuri]|uniref:YlbF family regulator n=1 Tax=Streptococcus sciuri TaxID=2973939 RepID=A0ABT2F8E2_9STRE|nr:YlbF family regulator [Streptococcus sciuri]MCS4488748.1 YlbF family regulator [Streptococcus sciuri]
MLIVDNQLLELDDAIEELVLAIVQTDEAKAYQNTKAAFDTDDVLQDMLADFSAKKEDYENLAAYGTVLPEVMDKKKELYKLKRKLDLYPTVIAFRQSEVALQELLATVAKALAQAVSSKIFVDTGLPLAPHKAPHRKKGRTIRESDEDEQ